MAILKGVKDEINVKVCAEVNADHGKTIKVPFVVMYKKPGTSEAKEVLRKLNPGYDEDGVQLEPEVTDDELMDEYVLGWSDVPTSTGEEFEFSLENLEVMLDVPEYRIALVQGLRDVLLGKAAMRKNLSRPGGRGR